MGGPRAPFLEGAEKIRDLSCVGFSCSPSSQRCSLAVPSLHVGRYQMIRRTLLSAGHGVRELPDESFGKASAWLESVIALMERLGDAAEEEGKFDYPERDENDEHLDNRFNHVLNQYPDVDI